jgi:PIN domain nuclease of toxin-antitoxin system
MAMLLDNDCNLFLSMASAWEIAIKTSIGRLHGPSCGIGAFLKKVEEIPMTLLPITARHLEIVESLPFIHRDPFDRLLIAAAMADGMTILTADQNIKKYEVATIW